MDTIGLHTDSSVAPSSYYRQGQTDGDQYSLPHQDISGKDVLRIMDFRAIQEMISSLNKLTGIAMALLDLEGNILAATGWQDICTKFHRVHPQTSAKCFESDVYLSRGLGEEKYKIYRCRNNMWDMATPITVGGEHVASLFLGQFHFDDETPDVETFIRQAETYGFDKEEYLAALKRIPRCSRETAQNVMEFYAQLAGMIAELSYKNVCLEKALCEQNLTESALRESEEKFSRAFSAAPSLLAISTIAEGRYIEVNESFERFTGYRREEAIGRTSLELNVWEAGTRARFIELIRENGRVRDFESSFRRKNGETFVGLLSAEVIEIKGETCLLILVNDITEKTRLEEEAKVAQAKLIQADKMASLGLLVSGIAHEVNNPNNFIMFNSGLLAGAWQSAMPILDEYYRENGDFTLGDLQFSDAREIVPRLFSGLVDGSQRIRNIVDKLKNFARRDTGTTLDRIDVNKVILDAITILDHEIKKRCENFRVAAGCDLPPAMGNAQQIEQVVINLLMNALQALPDKKRGILVAADVAEDGEHISVTVTDEGVGIPPEALERLTDPFFTTRSDCGGTGLGLSISASILREHRGELAFESELGRGTKATVRLKICR